MKIFSVASVLIKRFMLTHIEICVIRICRIQWLFFFVEFNDYFSAHVFLVRSSYLLAHSSAHSLLRLHEVYHTMYIAKSSLHRLMKFHVSVTIYCGLLILVWFVHTLSQHTSLPWRYHWHFTRVSRSHLEACKSCLILKVKLGLPPCSWCSQWDQHQVEDNELITLVGRIHITISCILWLVLPVRIECILSVHVGQRTFVRTGVIYPDGLFVMWILQRFLSILVQNIFYLPLIRWLQNSQAHLLLVSLSQSWFLHA